MDLGVDLDSRVAVVGLNGSGKSTLLKLMTGELEPLDGMVKRHNHLKIGVYHQHLAESLPADLTPLEYIVRPPLLPLTRKSAILLLPAIFWKLFPEAAYGPTPSPTMSPTSMPRNEIMHICLDCSVLCWLFLLP